MLAALGFLAQSGARAATIIDLTTAGANNFTPPGNTAAIGGVFRVQQISPQSTGTGVIDPFLRIQQNNTEQGYNTDLAVSLDAKAGIWTHALHLNDIPKVTLDGVVYRQFLLDLNEDKGSDHEFISLNQIQIFQSATDRNNSGLTAAGADTAPLIAFAGEAERFRLNDATDTGADRQEIKLNFLLNPGSGAGDMFLYVRDDAFIQTNSFVIFYSQFGSPPGANDTSDGFEEWAVLRGPTNPFVPEPATIVSLVCGLPFGLVALRRRLRRQPANLAA